MRSSVSMLAGATLFVAFLCESDAQDSEALFLPEDQTIVDGLMRRGTTERHNVSGISRLDISGSDTTYYVIDRRRLLREQIAVSLSRTHFHGSDISIRYDFTGGEYVHLMLEETQLSEVLFFKFEDWLSIQLSDFLESGDDPDREGSVDYLEYRITPSICSGLAEQAELIVTALRDSTALIGNQAPQQSGLVEIIVDGPYYSVSVRLNQFLNGSFGIGANAGPIFDAVHSTFRSVRECSQSVRSTPRKHDF